MITVDFLNTMYDKFIDSSYLTTKELLSIGFTNKDLTRLKENGNIASVHRGLYELRDANGLFDYSRKLVEAENFDRAEKVLDRCLEVEPDNGVWATRIFRNALLYKNFDRAFQHLDIMYKDDNQYYQHDHNFWLMLLSYVTELPDQYKEKVKHFTYDDILVFDDDLRYGDVEIANRIRKMVLNREFVEATEILRETQEFHDKRLYSSITFRLLSMARSTYYNRRCLYVDLIDDENYLQLINVLKEDNERWGLTQEEKYVLWIAREMVSMRESHILPKAKGFNSISFNEAICKHNYRLAKELYDYSLRNHDNGVSLIKKDKILDLMLKKVNDEVTLMSSIKAAKNAGADEFSRVFKALMEHDVDKAFRNIEQYLVQIDKYSYRKYVMSLIKLSLLDNDMAFTEPMLALSRLSRDDYQMDVSVYIQDFYFNLTNGNLKKAAIYLDIVSCSSDVGGIFIDVSDMRAVLTKEMNKCGMNEESLEVSKPLIKAQSKNIKDSSKKSESLPELASRYCQLADVISGVLKDDNIAMLEPMNDEDTEKVMQLLHGVSDIDSFVVNSADKKNKHIVLKYCGKIGAFIPKGETLRKAHTAYQTKNYEDCISLYESILPILKDPKSFVYTELGMAYYRSANGTDFKDAIDYLTLAMHTSEEEHKIDHSEMIERLKIRSGYNGIKVDPNSSAIVQGKQNGVLLLKKDKKN